MKFLISYRTSSKCEKFHTNPVLLPENLTMPTPFNTVDYLTHTPKKLKLPFYYWAYHFSDVMRLVPHMPISGFSYYYRKTFSNFI